MQTQTTTEGTLGHYWVVNAGTGVWRTAKANHLCRGGERGREHYIMKGERYLDTGERIGVWATYKCCAACAAKPCEYAVPKKGNARDGSTVCKHSNPEPMTCPLCRAESVPKRGKT